MNQIIGLSGSLGHPTSRTVIVGTPEMLASIAACVPDKNKPLYKGVFSAGAPLEKSVQPNLNDANQLALLGRFLHAFPRDLMGANDPHEFGYILMSHDRSEDEKPLGPSVQIDALFAFHNSLGAGYILDLPTGIPDDRRAKTTIETTP